MLALTPVLTLTPMLTLALVLCTAARRGEMIRLSPATFLLFYHLHFCLFQLLFHLT